MDMVRTPMREGGAAAVRRPQKLGTATTIYLYPPRPPVSSTERFGFFCDLCVGRPTGTAVHPAQGIALGTMVRLRFSSAAQPFAGGTVGPLGRSPIIDEHARSPGRRPGPG